MAGTDQHRRRRLHPDARRKAMIAEVIQVLAHEDPNALTVEGIARRIGASPALIHRYFGTKDGLVEAALDAATAELMASLVGDPALSPPDQLEAGLRHYLDFVAAHPVSWSSLIRATGPAAIRIAERVDARAIDFSLNALMPGAEVPPALRIALRGWIALIKDVCWRWLNEGCLDRQQVEGLLTVAYLGCLQAAVAADPAAQPALDAFEGR